MPLEMIWKLVRIGIHRRERQPREQPHGAGDLSLHNNADVALDMGVEIWANRLMDITHAKRLVVWKNGLIPPRRVEHNIPGGQHAKPLREPRLLPDDILVHLQAKPPGRKTGGIIHEVIGIIPPAGGETHAARGSETPVLRAIVLILEPAEAITEAGIRTVLHA